ncbi:GMC family oxidoreductase [Yersinia enterocolitica]|uniref:GMC family oxidoreductase n=1 Tax=Yersinia enterocolitica TaxID=630 RepID=UPI000D998D84|nr:GMC family oxidoreductase [Yersinia enterocolitica]SQA39389.1 putative oxidoreductase [Yersinia enterocolitica]SUP64391.1 putative oxidoreductase [Yersinia enterocolitica]HDM8271646.1 GMC family oxidoreductase [Yersinia enterocolitica]HED5564516.1 GMC family oxidoreductase [Yersinia enterocolitica]
MNMTTSATSKNSAKIPDKIDILILGGGMSGLELAKHLNNREVENIAIIEAGPADDCNHINAGEDFQRADEFWKNEELDKYAYRSWQSLSEPHYSKGTCLRRRVGGRSLYWHGVILPIEAETLKYWPAKIANDLTESWLGGPSLYTQVQSEILAWAEKSYDADYRFKFADFEFKVAPQVTRILGEDERWEAYSPLSYWEQDNTLNTPPLIISGYEAIALIITNGKCIGAKLKNRVSNEIHHVLADKCVLALGTIENSRLATQALYDSGILIEKKLTGLVDHIVQGFNVTIEHDKVPDKFKKLIDNHPHTLFFSPSLSSERFNLFFTINKSDLGIELEVWTMGEQIPSIHANISIATNGETMPLSISCDLGDADDALIKQEKYELDIFWREVCKNAKIPFEPLDFQSRFIIHARTMGDVHNQMRSPLRKVNYNVPITWISPLGTENHEGSTLPLGEILNDNHEFNQINNLFAIGPSTFPRPGAANPSLTTLALSRRLAYIL